jgi:preprotein translocase subunit SecD
MSLPCRALVCFALMFALACTKPARPAVLEFADVDTRSTPEAQEYAYVYDGTQSSIRLLEPVPFAVEDAHVISDENGNPAAGFELTKADGVRFRKWTADRIDRPIALLVDRKVYQVATVRGALPGGGYIKGGEKGFTKGEAESMVAALKAGAKH